MRLVDFSQHGGALAPETVNCWRSQGIAAAIVQYSERMKQHLDVLEAKAMRAEGYVYLYWDRSPWNQTPQDRTRAALAMANGRISRLWLDAEDTSHPYDEQQLLECVALCHLAGMETGIYTGRWWWEPRTGNSQTFAHLPLWHAEYVTPSPNADLAMSPDFSKFKPYGGWTQPTIWQYQGTSTLCGHSVDMNYTADLIGGGDELTPEEEIELEHSRLLHRLMREINYPHNGQGDGRYILKSRQDSGTDLLVEFVNADGSSLENAPQIWVRK